ncbi:MAG: hypothetical protein SVZ03_09785 [Spirochaetota bacterium]|nr:hypothetical protein [Spirochaetota bacterium]
MSSRRKYDRQFIIDTISLLKRNLKGTKYSCSRRRIVRIMRENNIIARKKHKYRITTDSAHNYPVSPNLINRNFTVDTATVCCVSDINYISTRKGWLYLCIIFDLFSKMIVGWSMASHIKVDLAIDALTMTVMHRKPMHEGFMSGID